MGELTIDLPKNTSGYVIIPRPYDNYMTYVDGELKDTEKYLGVMPAIYVDKNEQIFIKKKPCYLKPGFIISFVSLLFLATLLFFKRKSKNW